MRFAFLRCKEDFVVDVTHKKKAHVSRNLNNSLTHRSSHSHCKTLDRSLTQKKITESRILRFSVQKEAKEELPYSQR